MLKRSKSLLVAALGLLALAIIFLKLDAFASDTIGDPYVFVYSYEVTDGIIIPGEPFELTVNVKNADTISRAKDVLVTITNPDGIGTVYPSVSQVYIGDLEPGGARSVTFNMVAPVSYGYETASFYATVNTETKTNYVILTAPVSLDASKFLILSSNVPDTAELNQMVSSSIHFKVQGFDNLSNVIFKVYMDDVVIGESLVGNMRSGATKTQSISYYISEVGNHSLRYVIEGMDANGVSQSVEAYNGEIFVSEATVTNPNTEVISGGELSPKRKTLLFVSYVMICILILGVIWDVRRNRR